MKLELWGGVECTVNRVGPRYLDQLERSGHACRLSDLDLFAELGFKTLRYPILWERIQPESADKFDWTWSDERMRRLRELGIRPIIGLLHHGSGPRWTDLLDPAFPVKFAAFARAVAERYPWVDAYTPINEPLTTARFSALYGHWFPHRKDDAAFAQALVNQVEAVVRGMKAVRDVQPEALLIQSEDMGKIFGTPLVQYQADFENERRWMTFDLLHGRFQKGHPLWSFLVQSPEILKQSEFIASHPCPPDLHGVNYYVTSERFLDENLDSYPSGTHGSNGFHSYADVAAVRARPEGLSGAESILREVWARYERPIALTECHLGCTREEQVRWLMDAWQTCRKIQEEGIDVRAVTVWALLGAFDWNGLVTSQEGNYEPGAFDVRGPAPRRTALANAAHSLARTGEYYHPLLRTPGWWRRPDRSFASPENDAAPILILGGEGQLGRALEQVCRVRGLVCRALGRQRADVCDAVSIGSALGQYRPWAVINASGYTLVDEAEFDTAACFAVHSDGAARVASLCFQAGIPYVGISSDLVFDGARKGPYLETDAPRPLNAFGRSKEEGERRIFHHYPHALVIRTSPLFSPWSASQFAAEVLCGEQSILVPDADISPTYVPDLCQALLDLLVDGESGIWHLANEGALSWSDFAHALCRQFDTPPPQMEIAGVGILPAQRPVTSVLASQRGRLMPSLEDAMSRFHDEFLPTFQRGTGSRRILSHS